jgi:O-succinylbenzoic acid--CoA ligase
MRGSEVLFGEDPFLEWAHRLPALGAALVTLNPFLLDMLLRADTRSLGADVISLTAPLKAGQRAAFARAFGREPREIYGMTEAAGPVLLDGVSLGADTRLGAGDELELRGDQLFLGYGANGRFEKAPGWFPTGDAFARDADKLVHRARLRDLIDTGGRKIAPRILEEALEGLPEIAECLAFGVELGGVERAGIVYVRKPACALPREKLATLVEEFTAAHLSAELRPRFWLEVEALPRNARGKPDRKAARSRWARPGKDPKDGI